MYLLANLLQLQYYFPVFVLLLIPLIFNAHYCLENDAILLLYMQFK